MIKKIQHIVLFLFVITTSCVEEINIQTETSFESALVIEATITNEFKTQTIALSRTFRLEDNGPTAESGATVSVEGSNGTTYVFLESEAGQYDSQSPFSALPNVDYQLNIITTDGATYSSSVMQLTEDIPIGELYAANEFNESGEPGVAIYVDIDEPSMNDRFYRYEYEETYKIIAPAYSPKELIIVNDDFPYPPGFFSEFTLQEIIDFLVEVRLRDEQEQICFNTVVSNHIMLTSNMDLQEEATNNFAIRFIKQDNYIISHRYSVLVRQFIQSEDAHIYYRTLRDFSSTESLFSQIQVGFFAGNIRNTNNLEEKVIGFFEVSSVDERRLYFNYEDIFQGEILSPYYVSCHDRVTPALLEEDFAHNYTNSPLQDALMAGSILYEELLDDNGLPYSGAPFVLVLRPCGDCTLVGENSVPDFWVD